jgi:DNA processing protein
MRRAPVPDVLRALALAQLPGVGRRRLRQLLLSAGVEAVDGPAALRAFVLRAGPRLRLPMGAAAASPQAWSEAARLADICARRQWHVWVVGSAGYPHELSRLDDPPAILFVHGPSRLPDVPRVAIVGTREPTAWGEAMADACARAAVGAGAIVVSGLASGIDTAAHAAAVAAGGQTWAMLPCGLDVVYPASNQQLAERIVHTGGALVSEYLPATRPHPTFFVERDRLQAALSDALLVIETGRTGGTHHTIRFARSIGVPIAVTLPREVVAGAGAEAVPDAQLGTRDLWQQGNTLVTPDRVERWVGECRTHRRANGPPQDAHRTRHRKLPL